MEFLRQGHKAVEITFSVPPKTVVVTNYDGVDMKLFNQYFGDKISGRHLREFGGEWQYQNKINAEVVHGLCFFFDATEHSKVLIVGVDHQSRVGVIGDEQAFGIFGFCQ